MLMTDWIDLTKLIPGLNKGQWLHFVKSLLNPLLDNLSEHRFTVLVIDGSEINDSKSFFRQAKKVFHFLAYFGEN
jgi:hypothetical protein